MDVQMFGKIWLISLLLLSFAFGAYGVRGFALPALWSGTLQARGRVYRREEQTARFWGGIVFWFTSLALPAILLTLLLVVEFRAWRIS
jgi:hypothetical protein